MATTVHEPPKIDVVRAPELGAGRGGWRNDSGDDRLRMLAEHSSGASRTGIWVGIAAICMTFAALTSALVVRQGASMDWRHFRMPSVLYFNTVILFASSYALEVARKRVAAFARDLQSSRSVPLAWLYVTLGLGLVFVGGQYAAWTQLRAQGLYLATNPSSAFFYLLTFMHALHVLGGLGGLTLVISRLSRQVPTLRRSTLDTASYYWHFMDVLWLYLLLLLWMKL
jgi:cytochrome c oxidase subunit 3